MFDIGDIISSLAKIGVSLTQKQAELIKWRTSDDAKKYYSRQENKKFYKELKKGNMLVVDAIRKEKQKKIEDLKRSLLSIIVVLFIISFTSCGTVPNVYENSYDVNSVKETEKTHVFNDQDIKLSGDLKSTKFNGEWVIVHPDFIKTFNENQDTLIECLQKLKKIKYVNVGLSITTLVLSILSIIMVLRKRG